MNANSLAAVTRSVGLVCLITTFTAVAAAPPAPRLAARRVGSALSVSFDLQPQRADDLAPRLAGGQPVVVSWQLDVRRKVPFWRDIPIARGVLKVTARRGQVPGLFSIERSLNGHTLGSPIEADLEDAYRHLTSFAEVQLPGAAPVDAHARYRLAIKAILSGGGDARIATPWLAEVIVEH